jgi:hypothetical protein
LDDGRIVVANGGSQELRYFDGEGTFLFSVGQEGEGPGEFRRPTRVRRAGPDTLLVWDQSLRRISYLSSAGTYLGSNRLIPNRNEVFPGDEWLFDYFWIDSPLPPAAREPIRTAVRALPETPSPGEVWFLKVTEQGRIWASPLRPPADTALTWTVYELDGSPAARVTTPPRFEPHEIGQDYVLGVFLDELDVNYVRLYALEKPEGSPAGTGLPSTPEGAEPPPPRARSPREEAALAPVKTLVKNLASLEEIHYAEHYGYTADLETLFGNMDSELTEGLAVTILFATRQGWAATVTHLETGVYCALSYGRPIPMGWTPGEIICP